MQGDTPARWQRRESSTGGSEVNAYLDPLRESVNAIIGEPVDEETGASVSTPGHFCGCGRNAWTRYGVNAEGKPMWQCLGCRAYLVTEPK